MKWESLRAFNVIFVSTKRLVLNIFYGNNYVCIRHFWNSLEMILKEKCQTAVNLQITENRVLFGVEKIWKLTQSSI